MKKTGSLSTLVVLVITLYLPLLAFAQKSAPTVDPEELQEGQTLTCFTVLKGEKASAFKLKFEGTSSFPGWPKERIIIAKMKDKNLPVTAGMSGSPCYTSDDRFVGALSYNYTFFPMGPGLAGITPARALRNPDATLGGASPHSAIASAAASVEIIGLEPRKVDSLNKLLGINRFTFQPGEIGEWPSSGISERRIRSGESVTGLLVDGAVRFGFTCTVSEVTDKDFSVCGHDVFNMPLEYPAYRSRITTISRSDYYSYKIVDRMLEPVGTFTDDTIFAVKGVHEVRPRVMLPVHFKISKNGKQYDYDFQVLRHRFLSTFFVQWGIERLLENQWSALDTGTAKLAAKIYLRGQVEPLVIYDSALITMQYVEQELFEGYLNPWRILNSFRQRLAQIQESEWGFVVEKVDLGLEIWSGNRILMFDSLAVLGPDGKPTEELRPGESITVVLGMRNEDASQKLVRRFTIEVPKLNLVKPDIESKTYENMDLIFMSGNKYREMDPKKLPRARPDSAEEFLRQFTLNQREPSEMFAVLVLAPEHITGAKEAAAFPEVSDNAWTPVESLEFLRERNRASEQRALVFPLGQPLENAIVDFYGMRPLKLMLK